MKKVALISGITGQDGSFLAEFLIDKGYEVHGILRRSSSFNTGRIEHLYLDEWVRDMKKDRLVNLHYGDMTDPKVIDNQQVMCVQLPEEVCFPRYHLKIYREEYQVIQLLPSHTQLIQQEWHWLQA